MNTAIDTSTLTAANELIDVAESILVKMVTSLNSITVRDAERLEAAIDRARSGTTTPAVDIRLSSIHKDHDLVRAAYCMVDEYAKHDSLLPAAEVVQRAYPQLSPAMIICLWVGINASKQPYPAERQSPCAKSHKRHLIVDASISPPTSEEQLEAIQQIERITGIPLMHMDELEEGTMTAEEVFYANQEWIDDVATAVNAINFPSINDSDV